MVGTNNVMSLYIWNIYNALYKYPYHHIILFMIKCVLTYCGKAFSIRLKTHKRIQTNRKQFSLRSYYGKAFTHSIENT